MVPKNSIRSSARQVTACLLVICLFQSTRLSGVVDAKATSSSGKKQAFLPLSQTNSLSSPLITDESTAKAKVTTTSAISTSQDIRGGAAAAVVKAKGDAPTSQEVTGVVTLILIEMAFRKLFQQFGIRFPAQLAGCVALFTVMILAQAATGSAGDKICAALSPGSALLAKWMGVFFVPGLTMLPLAPLDAIGSSVEMVKAVGVVVLGFFYSLAMVTYSVLGVRKLLGNTATALSPKRAAVQKKAAGPAPKPYTAETLSFLVTGAVIASGTSILATRHNLQYQKPLETIFLGLATLASYVWGARLPSNITQIINPLVSSAAVTLLVARLTGMVTHRSMVQVLKAYTCKKLAPLEAGAGDLLLFLLSPSVISFAVGMYKGKTLIATNLLAIVTGVVTGSVGSLFGTAAFCRLIRLGGSQGAVLRLAAVPRSTQTALGMIIAELLGGDVAIAATLIILTGIFGGMVGVKTLDAWGVKDPVSRGLGIGSAGLSLGVVSIKGEPEAFAFAGLCLVLTAVAATCLASVPAVAELLINIAGGSAPQVM